jgi:hypothetical protein
MPSCELVSSALGWVFASIASTCVACEFIVPLDGLSTSASGAVDGSMSNEGGAGDASDPPEAGAGREAGSATEGGGAREAGATTEAGADAPSESGDGGTQRSDAGEARDACVPTPLACDGFAHACDGVIDEGCPSAVTFGAPGPSQILGGTVSSQASTAFSTACPAGQVLVGVGGSTGSWIDAAYGICGVAALATNTTKSPYAYSVTISHGATLQTEGSVGASDTPFTAMCPANEAVVGVAGNSGTGMDQLVLSCAPLKVSGAPGSFALHQGSVVTLPAVGDNGGGSPFTPFACPDPQVVTLLSGSEGQWLGQLGVACATPSVSVIP